MYDTGKWAYNALDAVADTSKWARGVNALSAGGNAASQAKAEGADTNRALLYGGMTAAVNQGTERLFGGIPGLGEGKVTKALGGLPGVSKAVDVVGEGVENALGTVIDPFLKRVTYDQNAQPATPKEIGQSALMGMATSTAFQLPSVIDDIAAQYTKGLNSIRQKMAMDDLAAVYEKNVGETLTSEGDYDSLQSLEESTDVITIGKSVGAKAKNYEVMDLDTGEIFSFVEGSKIQNVEVFAGKDSKSVFRKADKYAARYGGEVHDWQHAKGYALLDTPDGDREAEVHWVQCAGIGKFEFFIKEWLE